MPIDATSLLQYPFGVLFQADIQSNAVEGSNDMKLKKCHCLRFLFSVCSGVCRFVLMGFAFIRQRLSFGDYKDDIGYTPIAVGAGRRFTGWQRCECHPGGSRFE